MSSLGDMILASKEKLPESGGNFHLFKRGGRLRMQFFSSSLL